MAKDKKQSFEKTLGELEKTVKQLEGGDLSLEDSLLAFEKGVKFARNCQTYLSEAEKKIQILTQKSGEEKLEPFHKNSN